MYQNIPEELRLLPQWICWRYEDIGAAKPTKVPYDAKTGRLASVSDPATWSDFQAVIAANQDNKYSGIGFVFTSNDPYTFIDLDDPSKLKDGSPNPNYQADMDRQIHIHREMDSYSEISPSGKGLHIIVKGKIDAGRKRSFIEVYSSNRYATFTGNVYNNKPIVDQQDKLIQLWNQMGGHANTTNFSGTKVARYSDQEILERAKSATNADKFIKLLNGEWNTLYTSQSEADFAFIDILAFYSENEEQIKRMFRSSILGSRDKAKRDDYLDWMIKKSFDQMQPSLDFDGFKNAAEEKIAQLKRNQNAQNNLRGNFTTTSEESLSRKPNSIENQNEGLSKEMEGQKPFQSGSSIEEGYNQSLQTNFPFPVSIQSNNEMQSMPGKSPGLSGFSPQQSDRKNDENIINGIPQQKENIGGNFQVHNSVRQLSSETSLQGTSEIVGGSPSGPRHRTLNAAIEGSNPSPPANTITVPKGLLGEIAQFIYQSAPRPVPEIALVAAIGLLSGITGRSYNISGTGLNQYILLLAATGSGKESMALGIDKILKTIRLRVPTVMGFIGPSEIASGQALHKYLALQSQCFVSILGEFGLRLFNMASANASGSDVVLRRTILDLYNKSGADQIMRGSVYADKDKNAPEIQSPAFSILGESTPETFYKVLNEDMIGEGLLPRFTLIEYNGLRPPLNKNHIYAQPTYSLIDRLSALAAQCETLQHSNPRRVVNVKTDTEAQELLDEFDRTCDSHINHTSKDTVRHLWNRAHMKVMKLAALIAVGVNYVEPIIISEYVEWAKKLVVNDIEKLSKKFDEGEVGLSTFENQQVKDVIKTIKEYLTKDWSELVKYNSGNQQMHNERVIPYSFLSRRLISASSFRGDKLGSTAALKRCLQIMVDSDKLREVPKTELVTRFGTTQKAYMVSDTRILV